MAHSLTWNGTAFSTYGLIVRLATPAPTLSRTYDSKQTQDRAWAGKGQGAPSIFNLPVIIVGTSSSNLLTRVSTIRGLLDQEDECTLAFDMYTDRYWMAKFDSMTGDYTSDTTWEGYIIFTCHDRKAYATSASSQTETLTENISADYGGTVFAIAVDADGGYVYIAGGTTNTVRKLSSIDLSLIAESASYGGIIYALCAPSGDYVYCAGATTLKVQQLLKSDMTVNAESPSYGAGTTILAIADYGNYIYYGGDGGAGEYDICKLLKSDMTTIVRSADLGGIIYCSAVNSTHVFVGHADGAGHDHVGRYAIADLAFVDESDDYGDVIRAVCINTTTCFWCGDLDEVWYAAVGDLTTETQSGDLGSDLNAIAIDASYIYVVGDDNVVYKLDIAFAASASYVAKSEDYGGDLWAIALDDENDWLYIGGATTQTVNKLDTRHLEVEYDSSLYTGSGVALWDAITVDDNYFYANSGNYLYKFNKKTFSVLCKSIDFGSTINCVAEYGDYVYVASPDGLGNDTIKKLSKVDLSVVAESPDYGGVIYGIALWYGTYIYAVGATVQTCKRYQTSDMTLTHTSANYGGAIRSVAVDTSNVYIGGATTEVIRKLDLTCVFVADGPAYGAAITAVCVDSTYVYAGGSSFNVQQLTKATMIATGSSPSASLGDTINWLTSDGTYIYASTAYLYKLAVADLSVIAKGTSFSSTQGELDDGYVYGIYGLNPARYDSRVLWQRSDHEITLTSAGTASCGLDFASTASQANYWQQQYGNQTTGDEFDWEGTQASGEELEVDSELWYCTLEGASAMSGVSGEFLTLSPGANILYLENVTGVVVFGWTDRFA